MKSYLPRYILIKMSFLFIYLWSRDDKFTGVVRKREHTHAISQKLNVDVAAMKKLVSPD